jgi:hypothetical protein
MPDRLKIVKRWVCEGSSQADQPTGSPQTALDPQCPIRFLGDRDFIPGV